MPKKHEDIIVICYNCPCAIFSMGGEGEDEGLQSLFCFEVLGKCEMSECKV